MQINAEELVAMAPEAVEWLVPERLVDGGLNLLVGEVAAGKTFLALDLALGVAERGTAWGGLAVPRGQVMYYCLDSPPNLIGLRLKAMCSGDSLCAPRGLTFDFGRHDLWQEQELDLLMGKMLANRTRLVIFDVLGKYLSGMNENCSGVIGPLMNQMRQVCVETKAAILFIHHFSKYTPLKSVVGDRVRGSSDIFGSVDAAVGAFAKGERREVRVIKNRFGKTVAPLRFSIRDDGRLDFEAGPPEAEETPMRVAVVGEQVNSVLRALRGRFYPRRVIEEMMADFFELPGKRTLDAVFAGLGEEEGMRVSIKDRVKYYGYFGEDGSPAGWEQEEDVQSSSPLDDAKKERIKMILRAVLEEVKAKRDYPKTQG